MDDGADGGSVRRRGRRGSRKGGRSGGPGGRPRVDAVLGPLVGPKAAAVKKLPAEQQLALALARQGFTRAEIAETLGVSPSAVKMQLYRARKKVRDLLREGGHAPALVILLARHLRGIATRPWRLRRASSPIPTAIGGAMSESLTQLVALMIVAAASAGSLATPASAASSAADVRATPAPSATLVAALHNDALQTNRTGVTHKSARDAASPSLPAGNSGLVARLSPGSETPEDAQLKSAAAAPDTGHNAPVIVAVGMGRSCGCGVLFESTDGGASWTAADVPVPLDAAQVALPPDYPSGDPRIFLGSEALGGVAAYIVPRFGEAAMPLLPAGRVALAAGFDRGDDRAFVATRTGVMAVEVDRPALRLSPLLSYPPVGSVASLATPGDASGDAVLVLAPPYSVTGAPALLGPTPQAAVFACGADGATCVPRSSVPSGALQIVSGASGPDAAVSWGSGVSLSHDDGRTFVPASVPPGVLGWATMTTGRVFATVTQGTGVTVWSTPLNGGPWTQAGAGDDDLAFSASLFSAPGGRLFDLLGGGGLRCSADAGVTWHNRCS